MDQSAKNSDQENGQNQPATKHHCRETKRTRSKTGPIKSFLKIQNLLMGWRREQEQNPRTRNKRTHEGERERAHLYGSSMILFVLLFVNRGEEGRITVRMKETINAIITRHCELSAFRRAIDYTSAGCRFAEGPDPEHTKSVGGKLSSKIVPFPNSFFLFFFISPFSLSVYNTVVVESQFHRILLAKSALADRAIP